MVVETALTVTLELDFEDGISLYEEWKDFVEGWKARGSSLAYGGLKFPETAFVGDSRAFAYFFLQERIIEEAITGILLSLFLAFIVICISSGNWIISLYAVISIGCMVMGVIAFFVWNGWKLGVLEAVITVMVVGLSVDYTVHLSDSYIESAEARREDRVRMMLYRMGLSVFSGAFSTLGASAFLLAAYIVFFVKFGAVMFFLIAQSLFFSLVLYAALLDTVGPQAPVWGEGPFSKHEMIVLRIPKKSPIRKFCENWKDLKEGEGDTLEVTAVVQNVEEYAKQQGQGKGGSKAQVQDEGDKLETIIEFVVQAVVAPDVVESQVAKAPISGMPFLYLKVYGF